MLNSSRLADIRIGFSHWCAKKHICDVKLQNTKKQTQIRLSSEVDGATVVIPAGANNLFDHIPFE
jgi:hypothetical protein